MLKTKSIIYESPDGGKTVFAREFGSTTKQLIGNTKERGVSFNPQLWNDIHIEAKNNKPLQTALEQCKILFYLSKKNQKNII